jgi:hypothetical protein
VGQGKATAAIVTAVRSIGLGGTSQDLAQNTHLIEGQSRRGMMILDGHGDFVRKQSRRRVVVVGGYGGVDAPDSVAVHSTARRVATTALTSATTILH